MNLCLTVKISLFEPSKRNSPDYFVSVDTLADENEFIPIPTTVSLMPSVKQAVVRRVEAGTWIEDKVREGYNKGSWAHIKQSDKVLLKAWKVVDKQ